MMSNSWIAKGENLEDAVCEGVVLWHEGKEVVIAPEHSYLRRKDTHPKDTRCQTHLELIENYIKNGFEIRKYKPKQGEQH
jgi:hypothetical protein